MNEKSFKSMTELHNQAARYLQVHSQDFAVDNQGNFEWNRIPDIESQSNNRQCKECHSCDGIGNIWAVCRNQGGGDEQHCANATSLDTKQRYVDLKGKLEECSRTTQRTNPQRITNSTTNIWHCSKQDKTARETKLKSAKTTEKLSLLVIFSFSFFLKGATLRPILLEPTQNWTKNTTDVSFLSCSDWDYTALGGGHAAWIPQQKR